MRRLWAILTKYDTEPAELFVALSTALRGGWFLAFPVSGNHDLVYENQIFSIAFTVVGLSWLGALARSDARTLRRWLALASTALRTYAAVIVTIVSPVAVNVPFQFMLAVISMWLYIRLVRQAPR